MAKKIRSRDLLVAWGGALLLLVLHLDFWRPQRPILYLGWIPEELAYRLAWTVLAWGYLIFFTHRIWLESEAEGKPKDNLERKANSRGEAL